MNRNDLELTRDQQLIQSAWPDWLLQEEIGRGQYGIVYRAVRHGLAGDSHSAIKIVEIGLDPGECTYSPDQVKAYLESSARKYAREIQVMESVKGYSNIVSIEDYHICRNTGSNPWYVLIRMELLVSLYEYLENREITGELVTRLGSDLSSALEVCAAKQIAHRVIKPANVFVNSEGIFKLGDFLAQRVYAQSAS